MAARYYYACIRERVGSQRACSSSWWVSVISWRSGISKLQDAYNYICLIYETLRNLSKNCPSKHECFKCKGKHHISICPSSGNNSTNSRTTPKQEHPQKQSGNYCPSGSNEDGPNSGVNSSRATPTQEEVHNRSRNSRQILTALYVSASTPVLLQTANALTFKPGYSAAKAKALLILDSGSQRTYVSARLRDHLNLPTESSQRISIKTFGSTKRTCSVWMLLDSVLPPIKGKV